MTMDQPPPPGAPPPPGGRRPPTIDLTATEIESTDSAAESSTAKSSTAKSSAAESSAANSSTAKSSAAASADASPGNAAASDSAADSSAGGTAWLTPNVPWLTIGAGVAGGAVALAVLAIANLMMGPDTSTSALNARLAGLEQRIRDVAARPQPAGGDSRALDEVAARLAKLEATLATSMPGATDPALANRIAAIEGQVKALCESVSMLGRRTDEAVAAARDARQRAEANAAAPAAAQPGAPAIERSELETLANRVAAVERSEKAVEAELAKRPADAGDRALRLVVAASALKAAVERGDPFGSELAAVKAVAVDPKAFDPKILEPLEPFATSGVPTAGGLARELSGLPPSLLQATGAPPRDGGFLDKLQAGAEKLVRIRPIDEAAGNDPAAIVARIEVKASQADISGALAELAKLPAAARAPADAWIKKAEMRMTALEATRRISADALSGLSK
jgi:hypothetical protein